MDFHKRQLLKASLGTAALTSLSQLFSRRLEAVHAELSLDPQKVLDLPPGFRYWLLQKAGDKMSDGYRAPGYPDGMACFEGEDGQVILLRNHELKPLRNTWSPVLQTKDRDLFYKSNGYGGVSRLVIHEPTMELRSSNLVLAGTSNNCAGGPSPWGWVSCEESVAPGHGYAFLCDPGADKLAEPQILKSLGRFNHEAYAYDPLTRISYLTEDRSDGCFYRFVPHDSENPLEDGKLQALKIKGKPRFDTARSMPRQKAFEVEWVDIADPDPKLDSCRFQGVQRGAATFSRGEGLWYQDGVVIFSSTNGGPARAGQIFRLYNYDGATFLELLCESESTSGLDYPDNITFAPWGDIVIAEDGESEQFIRVLTKAGKLTTLARNAVSKSEFAGVCFSPSGRTLFLNIQAQGLTLAVQGPFAEWAQKARQAKGVWAKEFG